MGEMKSVYRPEVGGTEGEGTAAADLRALEKKSDADRLLRAHGIYLFLQAMHVRHCSPIPVAHSGSTDAPSLEHVSMSEVSASLEPNSTALCLHFADASNERNELGSMSERVSDGERGVNSEQWADGEQWAVCKSEGVGRREADGNCRAAAEQPSAGEGGSEGALSAEPETSALTVGDLGDLPEVVWIRLAKILDVSIYRARSIATRAASTVTLTPRTHALVMKGGLRFERLEYAAGLAQKLTPEHRATFDELVADLAPGTEWKRWRAHVDDIALSVQAPPAVELQAHQERRVAFWNNGDGTACLQFTGPVVVVSAAHQRLRAWSKLLRKFHGHVDQIGTLAGTEVCDSNAARPGSGTVRGADALGGIGVGETESRAGAGSRDRTSPGDRKAPHSREGAVGGGTVIEGRTLQQLAFDIGLLSESQCPVSVETATGGPETVVVKLRSDPEWLRAQAAVSVTVPALTLMGRSDLPGRLDDLSPIPAQDVQRLVGCAASMRRLLTDPVTGEVLPVAAQSYRIPEAVKATVAARWIWCTVPGCSLKASDADKDHCVAFKHTNPAAGGATTPANLHPLCRRHHRMKTQGTLGVEMTREGSVQWVFPALLAGQKVDALGSPVQVKHAHEWLDLIESASATPDALGEELFESEGADTAVERRGGPSAGMGWRVLPDQVELELHPPLLDGPPPF